VGGASSALRALALYGGSTDGLVLTGTGGIVVEGCHIGLARGSIVVGNAGDGINYLAGFGTVGQSCAPLTGCVGRRNVIVGNGGDGISIAGGPVGVAGNRIGTNSAGTSLLTNLGFSTPNQGWGVRVGGTGNASIGNLGSLDQFPASPLPVGSGNVVSGNVAGGILLEGVLASVFANRIGTDVDGAVALPGQPIGIEIRGDGNVVGSTGVGANVLDGDVIAIQFGASQSSSLNIIEGNSIGTNATNTAPLGSSTNGILSVFGIANLITANTIAGGTGSSSVQLSTNNDSVTDNYIGTSVTGADLGSTSAGLVILGDGTTIMGNVIGFNGSFGIQLGGTSAAVTGNYIGTDAVGSDLGNSGSGIVLFNGDQNVIGGDVYEPDTTIAGLANVIAFNDDSGVRIHANESNVVRGNSIHDNAGIGIDLVGTTGSTPATPTPVRIGCRTFR
jgi:hypothetical protein